MASVEKRIRKNAKGKTTIRWVVRWREKGSGKEPSKSFTSKTLADEFKREIEADLQRGEYISVGAGKVTFKDYAEEWLAMQTFEESSREAIGGKLRNQAYPVLGGMPIGEIRPSTIQKWLKGLSGADATKKAAFAHVFTVLRAAVADELIRKNPCASDAVDAPSVAPKKIQPWSVEQVEMVREGLPERFRIFVVLGSRLGLRQGEIFGLAVEDIDFDSSTVAVRRQVIVNGAGKQYFGPPKRGRERDVPLPESVKRELKLHFEKFPPVEIALPWRKLDGPLVSANLVLTGARGAALSRQSFNRDQWVPAVAYARLARTRENGTHMLRHVYASMLLDAGESIKAVSTYLGHADPAFTLKTYTHLLPTSDQRARAAIDEAFGGTST
ncbi:tyrosine-type recombinase/integrase [Myceligenerans pegani]|uniref:Site-specific integrase n=1 Tax=Myceligenerans pegani TaxID=2776917 RepID=A0ABR9MTY2_9MICO|nr:site-specific integrase [Myceligenerans sp. TRM 65318]MBE1874829.1 site-specific integrase [Myceligenerans sp. TRM 65318]MBE3017100.1 site-specific integrase [Myceligenerans sp. TRM 65318]